MTSTQPGFAVGVDVAGTDVILFAVDRTSGETIVARTPIEDAASAEAVVTAIRAALPASAAIKTLVISAAFALDAVRSDGLAKAGLITTAGFADVLDLPRPERPLDLPAAPIVTRALRREIPERTLAYGAVERKVDTLAVLEAAQDLAAAGCEAVAVAFVNAPANPHNEKIAAEALRAIWPNTFVTAAAELVPEIAEYERLSTATLNAALQPIATRFLTALDRMLHERGARPHVLVMQANGGAAPAETLKRFPVRTIRSGAAAGALAVGRIAEAAGLGDVIASEIGRTRSDVALVVDGEPVAEPGAIVASGQVIRQPMVAVAAIGAGLGAAITLDAGGDLRIGSDALVPASRGGEQPTLSDAHLLLGRLDPEGHDREAIERIFLDRIGAPLGLDAVAAAEASVRLADLVTAGAIRRVALEHGQDPGRFAGIVLHGDSAGLHATGLHGELGLASAVVPFDPDATVALGCALADLRSVHVGAMNTLLEDLDPDRLAEDFAAAAAEGEAALERSGVVVDRVDLVRSVDIVQDGRMRRIRLPDGVSIRDALVSAVTPGIPTRITSRRVAVIGRRSIDLAALVRQGDKPLEEARTGTRRVFAAGEWHEAPVYDRFALPIGTTIQGVALIRQPESTTYVGPGSTATVDGLKNLVLA